MWKLPDGDAFYHSTLRQYTTTDLSADQIHQTGLREPRFGWPDTDEGRAAFAAEYQRIIEAFRRLSA